MKLGQHVQVKVLEVDVARKRIALSIKQAEEAPAGQPKPQLSFKAKNHFKPPDNNYGTREQKKEDVPLQMNDALAMLKKKFGK